MIQTKGIPRVVSFSITLLICTFTDKTFTLEPCTYNFLMYICLFLLFFFLKNSATWQCFWVWANALPYHYCFIFHDFSKLIQTFCISYISFNRGLQANANCWYEPQEKNLHRRCYFRKTPGIFKNFENLCNAKSVSGTINRRKFQYLLKIVFCISKYRHCNANFHLTKCFRLFPAFYHRYA